VDLLLLALVSTALLASTERRHIGFDATSTSSLLQVDLRAVTLLEQDSDQRRCHGSHVELGVRKRDFLHCLDRTNTVEDLENSAEVEHLEVSLNVAPLQADIS